MAIKKKQVLVKRKYANGNIDIVYPQVRPKDVKVSSESTLEPFINKMGTIADGATKVESSNSNGNIKVDGREVNIYSHPSNGSSVNNTYNNVTVDKYGHVVDGSSSKDISDRTAIFNTSDTRLNITKTDNIAIIFGKISRWINDLKGLAFLDKIGVSQLDTTLTTEYNKRVTKDNVTQSLVITEPGWVADARVLPSIVDNINTLNNKTLKSTINIYVSTTGSDSTGNGTNLNPFKTISYAIGTIPKDLGGNGTVINIADGTYSERIVIKAFHSGMISLKGNSTNVIITSTTSHAMNDNTARVVFDTIKFTRSDSTSNPVLAFTNSSYVQLSSCIIDSGTPIRSGMDVQGSNIRFLSTEFNNCGSCVYTATALSYESLHSDITMIKCTGSNNTRVFHVRMCTIHLQDNSRPNATLDDIVTEGGLIVRSTGGTVGSLSSDLSIYVATTGSDNTADGSSTKPFKTIQRAIDTIPKDLSGYTVDITVDDGTYDEIVSIKGITSGYLKLHSKVGSILNTLCNVKNIRVEYCNNVSIAGFNMINQSSVSIFANMCSFVNVAYCQSTVSTGSSDASFNFDYVSTGRIFGCRSLNHYVCLRSYSSLVYSGSWSSDSNGGEYAFICDGGGHIMKGGTSQPIGLESRQNSIIVNRYGASIGTLSADISLYVATTGSNTNGTGTESSPFKTIQYAIDTIPKDLGGHQVEIIIADGTYDEDIIFYGYNSGVLTLQSSTPEAINNNCKIKSISVKDSTYTQIRGITVTSTVDSAIITWNSVLRLFYCQSTVTRTSGAMVYIGESTCDLTKCRCVNSNVIVLAQNSSIASGNWTSDSSAIQPFNLYNGTTLTEVGAQPKGNSYNRGAMIIHDNGTQISNLITSGLSCTWGTIEGGYVRHGNQNGTAMVTILTRITTTTQLSANTRYIVQGFPQMSVVPVTSVSNNYSTHLISWIEGISGTIGLMPNVNIDPGTFIEFNCTYLTNQ